jgi:pyridinium-3,5-bisthiocarboxylic acid mononucleotide nickel chelatase
MKTAYFDCFSGISGDMTLGALTALGVPAAYLKEQIAGLPLAGFDIAVGDVMHSGVQAKKVTVTVDEGHHPRDYRQIRELIQNSRLADGVKKTSLAIFERIAAAESTIHGCPKDEVHFHEVGGVDAIVDIVGACLGIEYLGIEHIIAAPLPLGHGWVQCQHGTLPVPAPATLEILRGLPVYDGGQELELVTPTGAAIIATLAARFGPLPPMRVSNIGYGAGTHVLSGRPNLLRVLMGHAAEEDAAAADEKLVMVETAIDDMNPELFGHLMDKLFADGALDVVWIPVHMKKNRPGTLVQVLCAPERRDGIATCIFEETTSLGVRFHDVQRRALARRAVMVQTEFGRIKAKAVTDPHGRQRIVPEFEVCRQIAQARGIPLRDVYESIRHDARPIDEH